jgi:hypothetical protein
MDIQENHKEHVLKTDHVVFQDVLDGNKTFEIRFNDRGYQVGDLVILKETEFTGEQIKSGQSLVYTGREIQKRISYVLSGYGLHEGWVILGIQDIKAAKAQAVPEGFVLVKKVHPDAIVHNQGLSLFKECQVIYGWNGKSKDFKNALNKGFYHGVKLGAKAVLGSEIEAQEQKG